MARTSRSCPECGAEASPREAGCPRCGHIFQSVASQPVERAEAAAPQESERASAPVRVEAPSRGGTGWRSVFAATCGCFVLVALAGAVVAWLAERELAGIGSQFSRVQQEADLIALRRALEAYADAHLGRYPERLELLLERDGGGPWIERLPSDRWGRAFVFEPPQGLERASGPGRLLTLGSDGEPGGRGEGADLDERALGLRPSPR